MTRDTARLLVEQALHLCQPGERALGSGPWPAETWPEWARRAEEWLRAEAVDQLVTDEMVQQAWTGVLHTLPGPHQYPGEDVLRVAISSVAADLYERGREDGRGDLIWHEERIRRECAAELRAELRRSPCSARISASPRDPARTAHRPDGEHAVSDEAKEYIIARSAIEERAVGMWKAFAVENADAAALDADPGRSLDLLHGIRFGAMAAIEILGEAGPEDET